MWNQTKYLTVLAVLLLAVTGCGAKATNLADGAAGQPATAAGLPLDLPSPAKLLPTLGQGRKTSALKFTEADVQQTGVMNSNKLPAHHVASNGPALKYVPDFAPGTGSLDGLAYAGYHFNLPYYDRNPQVRLTWTVPPADPGLYFIALANWKQDRWDWFPGNALGKHDMSSFDNYVSTFDDIAVLVLVMGSDVAQLGSVRIGGLPPVAAITVADPIGTTPYLPTLDASASTDPEGLALTYQYDFDGDGFFESLVGTDPTVEYNYGSNGDYQPRVRVTNSINASSEASVDVHALGEWSRSFGSNGSDSFQDLAVDHDGNIYAVGIYDHPQKNLLLSKWSPTGTLLWAKQWDSGDADYGIQLGLDSDGNVIVAGDFDQNSNRVGLVQKYTPDGEVIWSKYFDNQFKNVLMSNLLVVGTQIYCAAKTDFSGDQDILLTRFDTDGDMVWSAYRNSGGLDLLTDMQLIYDVGGAKRIALLSDSTIGGGPNIWKVEYNLDGTFSSGQQLGTSAQHKSYGKLLYYYDIFPTVVRYYVAGETDSNGPEQTFIVGLNGTGDNLWGKRYAGLDLRPSFLDFTDNGKLLCGGAVDILPHTVVGVASLSGGGTDLGLSTYSNPDFSIYCRGEDSLAGGMLLAGEALNSTLSASTGSLPGPNSFYYSFQDYAGSGGDAGLSAGNTSFDQQTDVTADGVLNAGGAGFDGALAWRKLP